MADMCDNLPGYMNGDNLENSVNDPKDKGITTCFGIRHVQCFLLFCCFTVGFAMRVNFSLAIVAMTDRNNTNPDFEEFNWDEKTKSLILSSFFWGYFLSQIPAGHLSQHYSAKIVLLLGILIPSLLNLLLPISASFGGVGLIYVLRVIEGLFQGVLFPATHTLLSKWTPINERGRLATFCYSGCQFGTVIMLACSGYIASSRLGWPGIFYISGIFGLIWVLAWTFYGASSPKCHTKITQKEREFLESSLKNTNKSHQIDIPTPWKSIFTSPAFLSLLIVHCTHNGGLWLLLTQIPSYLKGVMQLDIRENALLSALPYLVMCLMCYVFGFLADYLAKRQYITLTFNRKLFNTIGHWIPMISLIVLAFMQKDQVKIAVALLTIAAGSNAASYVGFQLNHIDIAPNHAGTLMGVSNCAASICSLLAPLSVGIIVTDGKDPLQWRIVFLMTAASYFGGNFLFLIFGKTNIQSWNQMEIVNI